MKIPRFVKGLAAYLSDWKNLLAHGLVGVALVAIPLALPLPPAGRFAAFIVIVALNLLRMRIDRERALKKAEAGDR